MLIGSRTNASLLGLTMNRMMSSNVNQPLQTHSMKKNASCGSVLRLSSIHVCRDRPPEVVVVDRRSADVDCCTQTRQSPARPPAGTSFRRRKNVRIDGISADILSRVFHILTKPLTPRARASLFRRFTDTNAYGVKLDFHGTDTDTDTDSDITDAPIV